MRKMRKLNRRSFLATVAGGAAAGSMLVVSDGAKAQGSCTDRDPSDPSGRGRNCTGCSDMDPGDPSGAGQRCRGNPPPTRTGCSDRDPSDPGGAGRNCVATGCSDRDPTDAGGSGRNCTPVRTQTACSQCGCPEYVATPGNRFAPCARRSCGHAANYHYGE
jgi:hypothetical protein